MLIQITRESNSLLNLKKHSFIHSMFTLEKRAHLPNCNRSLVAELAGAHLEEEDRESHEDERDDVRDEERSSAIPVIA